MRRTAQNQHERALAEHVEWEWHFTQLAEFIRRHGHADLGPHPVTDWLHRQCNAARIKELSRARQQRLRDLGIDLDQDVPLPAEEAEEAEGRRRRAARAQYHALWETRYAELCAYQAEHGHTNVTKSQNRTLGHWRDVQREFRRKGMLSADRIARLDAIGFEWEAPGRTERTQAEWHQHLWDLQFQRLTAFKERFGHCHVPTKWEEDIQLGSWVNAQRQLFRKGRLLTDRRQRLEDFGFPWDQPVQFDRPPFKIRPNTLQVHLDRWETRYAELCAYQARHGHTNVTASQDRTLAIWREVQRTQRRKGKLSPDRTACLDAIGFEWEAPGLNGRKQKDFRSELWERHFTELDAYQLRFGHCEVPRHWPENPALADWVQIQRSLNYRKRLNPERFARLDALGLAWTTRNNDLIALWETRYAELCAYQAEHGHTNVTKSQNRTLGHWRDVQREFRRKGMLKPDRIARLDAIGFEWEAPNLNGSKREDWAKKRWDEQFRRLTAFKDHFGHTQVPKNWAEDTALATWVADQRKARRKGRLPADRHQRLDTLDFDWRPATRPMRSDRGIPRPPPAKQARWDQRYDELRAFLQQHGHTRVPNKRPAVAQLCKWCYSQRAFRRQGILNADRIARLDALGFDWDTPSSPGKNYQQHLADSWDAQHARLTAFHQRFGHSRVPVTWVEDKQLVRWVEKQRKAAREGRLSDDRRARLDLLGFIWNPDNSPVFSPRPDQHGPKPAHEVIWLRHLESLRAFHQQHGHFHPSKSKEGPLYRWSIFQRKARRKGTLTPARLALLAALGFE